MSSSRFSLAERFAIKVRQQLYKYRTNAPFLSGDGFAELCDLRLEDEIQISHTDIKEFEGRHIFCRSDLVPLLLKKMKGQVRGKLLIAGNSDFDFEDMPKGLLDCFESAILQNSMVSNDKVIFTLPIGVENLSYGMNGLPRNLVSTANWNARLPKVLVGPFSPTHDVRRNLLEVSRHSRDCDVIDELRGGPALYAELVIRYRFVACPRGNGIDTHRFWESLYRGAVPVVKKSLWSTSLKTYGLPFLEVDEWSESEFSRVVELEGLGFKPSEISALWLDYWKERFLARAI